MRMMYNGFVPIAISAANFTIFKSTTQQLSMSTESTALYEMPVVMTNTIMDDIVPSTMAIDPFTDSDFVSTGILTSPVGTTANLLLSTDGTDDTDMTGIPPSHIYTTSDSMDLLISDNFKSMEETSRFTVISSDLPIPTSYSTITTNHLKSSIQTLTSLEGHSFSATTTSTSFLHTLTLVTMDPSPIPSGSHIPVTTSSSGARGKGILDNLINAPLWVWVVVAFVALAITSCCFIMCSVAACMSRKQGNKKEKRQKQIQAQECRRRSFKMKKMYGELEEGNANSHDKKKKESIPFSRWDSFRMSWSRRSSRKTISTFKPHLSQNQEDDGDTNSSDNMMQYAPAPPSMIMSNPNSQQYSGAPSSEIQTSLETPISANAFKNPAFGIKSDRWQQGALECNAVNVPKNYPDHSNPHW